MIVKHDKNNGDALGTGRRKSSVAQVRIRPGNGTITINKRSFSDYFVRPQDRRVIQDVLTACGKNEEVDVVIKVTGGGLSGQAGACRMGVARALVSFNEELYSTMRDQDFLTRDARMKERKKCGLHGARRGTQFSKR
jgi:small subunit ribosomal protein S9